MATINPNDLQTTNADSVNIRVNKKFLKLGVIVLGAVIAGGVIMSQISSPTAPDTTNTATPSASTTSTVATTDNKTAGPLDSVKTGIAERLQEVAGLKDYSHMPVETELIKKYGIFDKVKEAGSYKLRDGLSSSEIVKQVSIAQYDIKNYFGSIVAYNEGFVKEPKADNKGIITGFGYNPSMQSKGFNKDMFTSIGKDAASVNAAVSLTGVMRIEQASSDTLKKVAVVPQQASQMTEIMKHVFSEPVGKIIGDHAKLSNQKAREYMAQNKMSTKDFGDKLMSELNSNEKDTVLYHNYIVGSGGFSKYRGLLSELVTYHFNKTPEQADKVASHFTYKYTTHDGKVLNNPRATENLQTLFLSPEAWAAKIGQAKTYPDSAKQRLQTLKAQNAKESANEMDIEIYKQDMEKKGLQPNYEMNYKSAMQDKGYRNQVNAYRARAAASF